VSQAESGPHDCVMLRWQALRRAGSGTRRAPHGSVPLPSGEFGHVGRDRRFPERPGDRDPVLAVGDVVATVQPVGLNGGKRLSLAKRDHQCLKAPAAPRIGGEKVTVKLTVRGARGADDVPYGNLEFPSARARARTTSKTSGSLCFTRSPPCDGLSDVTAGESYLQLTGEDKSADYVTWSVQLTTQLVPGCGLSVPGAVTHSATGHA
jgi:hypothetical protein